MSKDAERNRLNEELSSYLKQHKDDLVHWWPYGPESLIKAKEQDKPIFISIGYATCHWCHVMREESFLDPEIADYLNQNFINIKIDKEEYPDLDAYFQLGCQLYSKSGGWPLSAFTLHDLKPFFVGTYFPRHNYAHPNMPTFMQVIQEVVKIYHETRNTAEENATKVDQLIKDGMIPKGKVEFQGHFPHPMSILEAIKPHKDNENGGFGKAPKFPNFPFYEWCLEQMIEGMVTKEEGQHIINTIEKMLLGAINDKGRGGIHRYSVDEKWSLPHFEKMLYDQAGLIRVLAKTSLIYPSPLVFDSLFNTLEYLKIEMLGEQKYFFAAQDADSEGVEGLYFTYTEAEFEDLLNTIQDPELKDNDISELKQWFGITTEGDLAPNLNTIKLDPKYKDVIYKPDNWQKIRKVRQAIIEDRKNRIPPATDNVGIASWNFMLISALCDVVQYCRIDAIKQMALNLMNESVVSIIKTFVIEGENNQVLIRHTTTKNPTVSYLEDYITYAESQLRLYQIFGNNVYKENLFDCLKFINKEFIKDGQFKTRANSHNDSEIYPNLDQDSLDNSLRSNAALAVNLFQKASLLSNNEVICESLQQLQEQMTHQCLKNPINCGEGLRALCYPKEAHKLVKVPFKWLEDSSFRGFMSYFMQRFVFDYNDGENDQFEICNFRQCELKGIGLKDFIKTLGPQKGEEAPKE